MKHHDDLSPDLTRRGFVGLVATGVAAASGLTLGGGCDDAGVSGRVPADPRPDTVFPELATTPFSLGIASGDPLSDSVILWTRLLPASEVLPDSDIPIYWEVAVDPEFETLVHRGITQASPVFAHAVHVDVQGLDAATNYWFRFEVGVWQSTIGKTRTLPAADASPETLRFAFTSCQHYEDGYYAAHRHLAAEDVDLVLFLGDYIYEGGPRSGNVRIHDRPEVTTLEGYRSRYALYKRDPDLQSAHASAPWVVTWDDHDVENNYAGTVPQDPGEAATFADRRAAAYQAFYEHHPVRVMPPAADGSLQIYRTIDYGDLVRFFVVDTRQYRTDQPCDDQPSGPCADYGDGSDSMLGDAQERWLLDGLAQTPGHWTIMAQSVVFSPVPIGGLLNFDQWDGYPTSRARILDAVEANAVANFVVLTGDIHAAGIGDIMRDPTAETPQLLGTELVAPSVTSNAFDNRATTAVVERLVQAEPAIRYFNMSEHGYALCTVTRARLRTEFKYVAALDDPAASISVGATFLIASGVPGAERV
ncbi:MAG: alkaline phosphatase D [Myxococcota bacterium]|jgi:alkaline phosphatase D